MPPVINCGRIASVLMIADTQNPTSISGIAPQNGGGVAPPVTNCGRIALVLMVVETQNPISASGIVPQNGGGVAFL